MKYAVYSRVSTDKQTNVNQEIRLREFTTTHSYEFDYFEETESSRKTRPVKQALLQKLRNKEYAGVIVYRLDRWARSYTELILELDEFMKKDIVFISVSDNLDFSTASGRLHFHILSAFAQFERDLISERTKEGLRRARLQGKIVGRPKGSKDKKPRPKAGYLLREANKRKQVDERSGLFKPLENYLSKNTPPNN